MGSFEYSIFAAVSFTNTLFVALVLHWLELYLGNVGHFHAAVRTNAALQLDLTVHARLPCTGWHTNNMHHVDHSFP